MKSDLNNCASARARPITSFKYVFLLRERIRRWMVWYLNAEIQKVDLQDVAQNERALAHHISIASATTTTTTTTTSPDPARSGP